MLEPSSVVTEVSLVPEDTARHERAFTALLRAAFMERLELEYAYDSEAERFRPVICVVGRLAGRIERWPIAMLIEEHPAGYLLLPSGAETSRPM